MQRYLIVVLLLGLFGCKTDSAKHENQPASVPPAPGQDPAAPVGLPPAAKIDPSSLFGEDATVAMVSLNDGFTFVVGAQEYDEPKPMAFLWKAGEIDRAAPDWLTEMVTGCDGGNQISARKEGELIVVQNECSGGEDSLYTDTHAVVLKVAKVPANLEAFRVRWSGQVGAMTSSQVSGCEWGDNGSLSIEGGHGFIVTDPWQDRHDEEDTETECSAADLTPSKKQVF